jgi:hypothetical protein
VKTFRARSGPFDQQLRFTPQEIDSMCIEALTKAEALPASPAPVRIDWFIETYFNCIVAYEDLDDGVLGCTAFNENGSIKAVFLARHLEEGTIASKRRVRSTLAHEGGHCLMHAGLFAGSSQRNLELGPLGTHENLDFKNRRILCREEDFSGTGGKRAYNGRWWEWQANRAIGGFLLPTILIRQAVAPFGEPSPVTESARIDGENRQRAVAELARVFEVNPVVARIRLAELFPLSDDQFEF